MPLSHGIFLTERLTTRAVHKMTQNRNKLAKIVQIPRKSRSAPESMLKSGDPKAVLINQWRGIGRLDVVNKTPQQPLLESAAEWPILPYSDGLLKP